MNPDKPLPMLGGLTIRAFLKDYWQKKPLFVKNALPEVSDMITADELAGLSLEPHIESRLIQELPNNQWKLEHGPFPEERFSELPEDHWTLVVQAVDHHLPEFSQFLESFKFIPSWRLDDIMITYATDKGSVGPHYDYYDVFLIQLHGNREWQTGQQCDETEKLLPDLPVRVLEQFELSQTWDVEPGDLLYLPPGLAHHGVANGECMTLSVGFRAPSNKDLLSAYTDFQLDELQDNLLYSDPELTPQENTGWIPPGTIEKVKHQLIDSLDDAMALENWFCSYISSAKYSDSAPEQTDDLTIDDILDYCSEGMEFLKDEASRTVYAGLTPDQPSKLFINGENINFPDSAKSLILLCCNHRALPSSELLKELSCVENQEFFLSLVRRGTFYIDEPEAPEDAL